MNSKQTFNPPPGWPVPPAGWVPPKGWQPDPSWPAPPANWQLWIHASNEQQSAPTPPARTQAAAPPPKPTRVPEAAALDVRISRLEAENAALKAQLISLSSGSDIVVLNDERVLQDVGIYRYHHPLPLGELRDRLDRAGFDVHGARRFLWVPKTLPDAMLGVGRATELALEALPVVNRMGATTLVWATKRT